MVSGKGISSECVGQTLGEGEGIASPHALYNLQETKKDVHYDHDLR
jgi:hypothetical protein